MVESEDGNYDTYNLEYVSVHNSSENSRLSSNQINTNIHRQIEDLRL